jgi:hypothetical protein
MIFIIENSNKTVGNSIRNTKMTPKKKLVIDTRLPLKEPKRKTAILP